MTLWKEKLAGPEEQSRHAYRMILSFKDSMELFTWIRTQAAHLHVPYSQVVKAILRAAMENEKKEISK